MRQRFRLFASVLLVMAMLLALVPARGAQAANAMTEEEAISLLKEYNIVRGDPSGAINVNDKLTRAQAAAVFVRVLNMESLAKLLPDVVPFTDARGHWAAGEIAMVERVGLMRGDGNGLFRPDDEITYIEVLTVLLRMVDQEPTGPWNPAAITVTANRLGIAPQVSDLKSPAIRGKMFWSLAAAISNIPVDENLTLLQKHWDSTPPRLVLEKTTITTPDDRVTIRGVTEGATKVLVNDKPAQFDPKTGAFSYQAQVPIGPSTLVVKALDYAGNQSTASVSVDRRGVISRLRVTGPATLLARTSTKLNVEVKDSRGNDLPRDEVAVEMTGNVATFNLATDTLTTSTATGRGTLTLKAGTLRSTYSFEVLGPSSDAKGLVIATINGNRAPAVDQKVTVTVQVVDQDGQLVANDYGRTISLKSQGLGGLVITPIKPVTDKGIATFSIQGSRVGAAELEASSAGLTSGLENLEIVTSTRIVLSSSLKTMKPDGTSITVIRATLTDQNGRAVNNATNADIQIQLSATGTDGVLTDDYVVIPRGRSNSSGNDGAFQAGITAGTALIKGAYVSSNDAYSIQSLEVPVTDPLAGVKLQVTTSPTSAEPGDQVTLTLKVLDAGGRVVSTGAYAFQLKLSTSNGDPMLNGMPDGAELTFANSSYTPVDDGRADNDPLNSQYSVIGRTQNGTAQLTLRYNRSGNVTVAPVGKASTYEAYNPATSFGPASATSALAVQPVTVTFAGTPSRVVLTADSDLAANAPGAATNTAKQVKVRATVVDSSGAVVPGYNQTVTLTRLAEGNGISSIGGITRKAAVNGVAEFTVNMTGAEGFDLYRATVGTMVSTNLTVSLHKEKPEAPHIVAVRGIKEGDLSPETGYVGPEADYMDIQLLPQASYLDGEPTNWVVAKVYRKGESREFFKSGAINLNTPVPTIRIPKSLLNVGEAQYEVVVHNGAGDSIKSPSLDDTSKAMNTIYYSGYRLTNATYDAVLGKLTLAASGLASNGAADLSKIRFTKGDEVLYLDPAQVSVQTLTSSSMVLLLGDMASSVDPDRFHGATTVVAETGWFISANGSQVAQPQTVTVTPMAVITQAAVDATNKYLYLYGDGFRQGTLTTALLKIHGGAESVTLNSTTDKVKSLADSQIVLTLSAPTLEAIMALQGPLHLTADAGWLKTSTGKAGGITGTEHPVYLQVKLMSGAYDRELNTLTLRGSGFAGAIVDPSKLSFRRTTTTSTWKPSTTEPVTGSADDTLVITFSEDDAATFETQFGGKNIYVNTLQGWLVDDLNREALPVPSNSVLFTVPAN